MEFQKLKEIVSGYKNLAFPSEHHEKLAEERSKICAEQCDQVKETLGVMRCNVCGCVLAAKIRSTISECPLKKW